MSEKVFCEYCGTSYASISLMSNGTCNKNPAGKKHVLYEGSEKAKYTCKYCGMSYASLSLMSNGTCNKNPTGKKHSPAR